MCVCVCLCAHSFLQTSHTNAYTLQGFIIDDAIPFVHMFVCLSVCECVYSFLQIISYECMHCTLQVLQMDDASLLLRFVSTIFFSYVVYRIRELVLYSSPYCTSCLLLSKSRHEFWLRVMSHVTYMDVGEPVLCSCALCTSSLVFFKSRHESWLRVLYQIILRVISGRWMKENPFSVRVPFARPLPSIHEWHCLNLK